MTQGCSSVLAVLAVERRVKVMAWLVDTEPQLTTLASRTINTPTHIISNTPLTVAPGCVVNQGAGAVGEGMTPSSGPTHAAV